MTKRLYLDLDGVMADFDAHYPATFGHHQKSIPEADMWANVHGHGNFFGSMPPCPGALDFFASIKHLDPIVLTACPSTGYAEVARQKRAWVRQHLSPDLVILPVMGGRNKPLFMHAPGDVLIDDWQRNCQAWEDEGGDAIRHDGNFELTAAAVAQAFPDRFPDPAQRNFTFAGALAYGTPWG